MSRFVLPMQQVFSNPAREAYLGGFQSYSHYNYLRRGLIPWLKRRRFGTALQLAAAQGEAKRVLDIGCADGVFLPSLAERYKEVVGVDVMPQYLAVARELIDAMDLKNVSLVCDRKKQIGNVGEMIGRNFDMAFVLETLEHVGAQPNMYESKADFIEGVFSLLGPDGYIVVSVPRMVGLRFLAKHLTQLSLRIPTEQFSVGELVRAAFLRDTSQLEPKWNGSHLGFSHLRLKKELSKRFAVQETGTLTSVFFTIRRK